MSTCLDDFCSVLLHFTVSICRVQPGYVARELQECFRYETVGHVSGGEIM